MRISCKTKALVKKFTGVHNEVKDGTIREVDLMIRRTRPEFAATFGDELATAVFAGYVSETTCEIEGDDEVETTQPVWKLKNPKPSKRVVCENHKVTVEGESFVVQPKLRSFETVDDAEMVKAIIRFELGQAQVALRKKLEDCVGVDVDVEIEPSTVELPFGQKTTNLSDRQMEIVRAAATTTVA